MAQGILGNTIADNVVTIPKEDYDQYLCLLKGVGVLIDLFRRNKGIDGFTALTCIGTYEALTLRDELFPKGGDQIE